MNKTWKPIAAGVLDIIGGVIQLVFVIIISIARLISDVYYLGGGETLLIITLFILSALLAIYGGIFCIKRTKWPMAITGSFAASALLPIIVVSFVEYCVMFGVGGLIYSSPYTSPGIAAIVLTVLSKKEFE